MRSILAFAIAAIAIAAVVPRVVSDVGRTVPRAQVATPASVATPSGPRKVTLSRDRRGHFLVDARVEGRRMNFLVDTGATVIALRERDAGLLGFHPGAGDFTSRVSTANGTIHAAPVRLASVEVEGLIVRDVPALILPDHALAENLLGMAFLGKLKRFEFADGQLVMEQ